MNYDPKMAANERVKQEKDGLDIWPDIHRYAKEGFAAIPEADFARMRWYGIYQQKPNDGYFMWRIKLPGGRVTPAQLHEIGLLANQYGRGFGDITTRQDIQLHWMSIADFPDALDRIYNEVGLYTDFSCGDTPRNTNLLPARRPAQKTRSSPSTIWVQRVSDMFRDGGKEFSQSPAQVQNQPGRLPAALSSTADQRPRRLRRHPHLRWAHARWPHRARPRSRRWRRPLLHPSLCPGPAHLHPRRQNPAADSRDFPPDRSHLPRLR